MPLHNGLSAERKKSARPWSLKTTYRGTQLSTVCDLVFAIGDVTRRKRYNFLVEVDRGHMPVERASLQRTSILRKLVGYAKAWEDGLHKDGFGWQNFRVLILTTSEQRVQSCIAAARKRFGDAAAGRIFLFGTMEAAKDMLGHQFIDIDGRGSRLIGT